MGYATQILVLFTVYMQLRISSSELTECFTGNQTVFAPDGQPPEAVWVDFGVDGSNGGGNLVLPCEVMGSPTPTVSWFREGVEIASNVENGTLSIRVSETTASSDGTIYHCEATNMIGPGNSTTSTLRSRNVTVRSAYFQSREENVSTIVGGAVSLECAFSSDLLASNVRWFADDNMITASENMQFLEGGQYLYIPVLSETQRGMRYRCEVSDFLDENRIPIRAPTTYTLNTDISEGSIVVYKNQSTVSGRVNETLQLVFVAAARDNLGRIAPNVLCREPTSFVTYEPTTETTAPVTLTAAASNVDQVQFTCQVSAFPLPGSHDVVGTIIVSGPEAPEAPASIMSPFEEPDRDLLVGDGPVEYSCEASGSPDPTITWYYNGAVVQSGSGGVVVGGDGTLTISAPQVSHSGIYQCFARNQFGEDSREWILEVADPVIEMVVFDSNGITMKDQGQGNLLYAPSDTTNLVVTATVDSTTIRGVATCDSCPQVQLKLNGTDTTAGTVSSPCNDDFTSPYVFRITIPTINAETVGNYSVVFTVRDTITRESQGLCITSSARPVITRCTGGDQLVKVGEDLELQCMFLNVLQTSVLWSRDGNTLSNSDDGITITTGDGISTLRITSVTSDGDYTFMTNNDAGSDSRLIQVEVESSSDTTVIVVAAVVGGGGGALVLIGSGVIVVVVVKKVSKPKDDEEDGEKPKKKESRVYTDPPHATATVTPTTVTDFKGKEAIEMPDMGAMYADPKSIPHETANTGQEYAVSTKKGTKPPQQQAEPPSGDLYSVPDKSKKQKNQDLTYAVVETRPARDQMKGNKQQLQEDSVTYSDITHPSPL